ncbi:MAG TPA: metalloregulator ArsR/SmtB family transcription factor [Spirochaetota bacterium]|nr:metalloregulator ArsR/SmtB family transcription factor [Spirochaetota bacterium]
MDYNQAALFLKAMANPTRLAILAGLDKNACHVNNFVKELNIPQSTVSQHLAVLRQAGVVYTVKEGYNTCYHIKDCKIKKIIAVLRQDTVNN